MPAVICSKVIIRSRRKILSKSRSLKSRPRNHHVSPDSLEHFDFWRSAMARKPTSAVAGILVVACACAFRVDPMALQVVTSPVLVRALIRTVAGQLVGMVAHCRALPTFGGGAV